MPTDRTVEPWPEATYHGFAGPARAQPPPSRRRWPIILAAGAGAAIVLGAGAGLLLRPHVDNTDAAEARAPGLPIQVNRPAPLPPPKAAGKLEVLPPGQVAASAPPPNVLVPTPAAPAPSATYVPGPPPALPSAASAPPRYPSLGAPTPAPAVRPGPLPVPPPQPQLRQQQAQGPGACAGSLADQMVCSDPRLGAADRELNRAYRRALAAGVPPQVLRSQQREWLDDREEAAHRSPRAVANIYDQRIDELNSMASDARRNADDEDDGPD